MREKGREKIERGRDGERGGETVRGKERVGETVREKEREIK